LKFDPKVFITVTYLIYQSFLTAGLYFISRKNKLTQEIIFSILFFSSSPLVLLYSRYPMVEFPLYILTALSIIFFLYSDNLEKSPYWQLFIITIVCGLLIKFSFTSFVIFPSFLLVVAKSIKSGNFKIIRRLKQFSFFLVVFSFGIYLFAGLGYFIQNYDHSLSTEVAAWWSYPYFSLLEKIWWILIAPTQVVTVPIYIFMWIGILKNFKKVIYPFIFLIIPLVQFGLFMQSKGARLFAPITFSICVIAAYGFSYFKNKLPKSVQKYSIFVVSLYVVINVFTSGYIPLDFAPAFVYPEGGSRDIFHGLTLNFVSRGGIDDQTDRWEKAKTEISAVIKKNTTSEKNSIIFLFYRPDFTPTLNIKSEGYEYHEYVHELLWSQAQRFPHDLFIKDNTFFVVKTGNYTHWLDKGTGLELESTLRFLNKELQNPSSIWRMHTDLAGKILLPDSSYAYIYKRTDTFNDEETALLYESYLTYDRENAVNNNMAQWLIKYYSSKGNVSKKEYYVKWIRESKIEPRVLRLVSKSDIQSIDRIRQDVMHTVTINYN
jgi:MFS family permease